MTINRKYICFILAALLAVSTVFAEDYDSYLQDEIPDPLAYLPPPPDTTMLTVNGDYVRWIWGKSLRDTPRGEIASGDSKFGITRMCVIYSDILGIDISEEGTPAIYRFMARSGNTGAKSVSAMKHAYFRKRPFLLMNEPTWGAYDTYENLGNNSSYPSSHTGCGWGTALALAEMAPHLQDTILRRGYDYGISRVITGAHWQSDVDAAMVSSSAAIARAHATSEYQADLAAAREEYMQLTGLSESQLITNTAPAANMILDEPAMDNSYFYYGEVAPYWQAKGERNTERGAQAITDANLNDDVIISGFAQSAGIDISNTTLPNTTKLLKNTKLLLGMHAFIIKDYWYRNRPYVQFGDSTLVPADEDTYRDESSYPSGHAIIGWGMALVLTEVMPDRQNEILKRGYDFGWSSVITGYQYPTDVISGRIMAACLLTKMHNDAAFNNLLEAAKQEYAGIGTKNIKSNATLSPLLPSPPDSASVSFAADFYRWIWGKKMRDTELGDLARHDSQCGIGHLCEIYSELLNIDISENTSPAIYNMISQAAQAGKSSIQSISTAHSRKQPFVLMNEQPWGINDSNDPPSHPSTHAAMVWSTALAMAQMAPQLQDTILSRLMQCATSGVITGFCWQSDVDNALTCASAAIAKLRGDSNYAALSAEAQNEYLQLAGLSTDDINAQFPSIVQILDNPTSVDDLHFFGDLDNYWQGMALRDTERGWLANDDASIDDNYIIGTFNDCAHTITISESNTPNITMLIKVLKLALSSYTTTLKNTTFRLRPFRQFNETIPYGGEAWKHYSESSYPSRHALLGWGIALTLAEVMPDCHDALIKRGYDYGESRAITGLCYASDVRDARIIAAAATNKLHNTPLYVSLINEAKAEYEQLKWKYGDVNGDGSVTSVDLTALYNWLLNSDDSNLVNGDLDGDGSITTTDITIVYNILLGNQNVEK